MIWLNIKTTTLLLLNHYPIFVLSLHLGLKPIKRKAPATKAKVITPKANSILSPTKPNTDTTSSTASSVRSGVRIPLHAGSSVLVYKEDLIRIYSTEPSVYTARLSDLVFGKSVMESWPRNRSIEYHEPLKMFSLTSNAPKIRFVKSVYIKNSFFVSEHVVQLYQRSADPVTLAMVKDYIRIHVRELHKKLHNSHKYRVLSSISRKTK